MNPAAFMSAGLGLLGLIGNGLWMLTNLRIENRIGSKIDDLKNWMESRYVSVKAFEGCQDLCSQRHAEVCRRLVVLERSRE